MASRKKVIKIIVISIAVLCILAALAPMLIFALFGKSILESQLRERMQGNIEVADVAGGWSGASIGYLKIGQPPGFESVQEPLLEVRNIKLDLPLIGAAFGNIAASARISDVRGAFARAADGTTNLQKMMKPPAPGSGKPGGGGPREKSKPPGFTLHFVLENGRFTARDLEQGAEASIDKLRITADRTERSGPVTVAMSCDTTGPSGRGSMNLDGNVDPDGPDGNIKIVTTGMDLDPFAPFFTNAKSMGRISGRADTNITIQLQKSGNIQSDGKLLVRNLSISGGSLKAPIVEPLLDITPKLQYSSATNVVTLDGFSVLTSFVKINGRGSVDPAKGGTIIMEADGDLARMQKSLAPFFPSDVQLDGIIAGRAELLAVAGAPSRFNVNFDAKGIRATGLGDAAATPTNGILSLEGSAAPDFSVIEVGRGTLDFGPLANGNFSSRFKRGTAIIGDPAAVSPGSVDADAKINISIADIASRFRALIPAGLLLDGSLQITAGIHTNETQEAKYQISSLLRDLKVSVDSRTLVAGSAAWMQAIAANPLNEPLLSLDLTGTADNRFGRFEISQSELKSGSNAIQVSAKASGGLWNLASNLRAAVDVSIDLKRFSPYIAPFAPPRLTLDGGIIAKIDLTAANGYVKGPAKITADKLFVGARPRSGGPATSLDEALDRMEKDPVRVQFLQFHGDVSMNRAKNEFLIPNVQIRTEPSIIHADGALVSAMELNLPDATTGFDGTVGVELDPFMKLIGAFVPSGTRASGSLTMKGGIKRKGFGYEWNFNGYAKDFSAQTPGLQPMAPEPELGLAFAGRFTPGAVAGAGFECVLERTKLDTKSGRLAMDISGMLNKVNDVFSGSIAGPFQADLQFLQSLAPAALPAGTAISGRLNGNVNVVASGETVRADTTAFIDNFSYMPPAGGGAPVIDPRVTLQAALTYQNMKDELDFSKVNISTSTRWMELAIGKLSISDMRTGRGLRADGTGTLKTDLGRTAGMLSAMLPPGTRMGGALDAGFQVNRTGAITKFSLQTALDKFVWSMPPREAGGAPLEVREDGIRLALGGIFDSSKDEIAFDQAGATTSTIGMKVDGRNISIRSLSTDRKLGGQVVLTATGQGLSTVAAAWLPAGLTFEKNSNITLQLSGTVGTTPLASVVVTGDAALPAVVYQDIRLENPGGKFKLQNGLLDVSEFHADFVKGGRTGKLASAFRLKLDDAAYPFGVSWNATAIPANRALDAPLGYVFPLFAGNYQFATFDGVLDSQGSLTGNASDWRKSLAGDVVVDMKDVKLVSSAEFGQVLDILNLNPLNSSYKSIRDTIRIADGKIQIQNVEIDGDSTRLPLTGAVGLDGAMSVGIDLGRARLGKRMEPYRPIIGLFRPQFAGNISSPGFGLGTPKPQQILQAAGRMAAGSILGGQKFDVAKLSKVGSLADLSSIAESDAGETAPTPGLPPVQPAPQQPGGTPPQQQSPPAVDAPLAPGGMPAALARSFRSLAVGKTKFNYRGISGTAGLADRLRAWLEAPPPAGQVATPEARLADALNRYEVALSLAVARELEDPLFDIKNGKKGVHGIDGFWERNMTIAGAVKTFASMKEEIRESGGEHAFLALPGAAEDYPWIDRAGYDANRVKKAIDDRAAQYLLKVRMTPKGLIAVPRYIYKNLKNDEAKIRTFLRRYLPAEHAVRGKLDDAKLANAPENLELDQP